MTTTIEGVTVEHQLQEDINKSLHSSRKVTSSTENLQKKNSAINKINSTDKRLIGKKRIYKLTKQ